MTHTPVVHVVDDDDSLRTAVTRILQGAGYQVRGYASAGEYLLAEPDESPGCLVLDVRMPGPSGLDLQKALTRRSAQLPIVFLTAHGDIPMSVRAIKSGAADFLTKPVEKDALLAAVRSAIDADTIERAQREQLKELRERYDLLTSREQEVFSRVVAGELNKRIAADLEISERTVKAHRAQIMRKFRAGSLAGLVHIAEQLDLVPTSRPPHR